MQAKNRFHEMERVLSPFICKGQCLALAAIGAVFLYKPAKQLRFILSTMDNAPHEELSLSFLEMFYL